MQFNNDIKLVGTVKIISKDLSGKILEIRHGNNLVLNTGYTALLGLISGKIAYNDYPKNIIKYAQFGINGITPLFSDAPSSEDGKLNTVSPLLAVTNFQENNNSVTFQAVLPPHLGNSLDPDDPLVYKEVVLLMQPSTSPITYSWFSRRCFSDLLKLDTILFELSWTFSFYPNI